MQRDRNGLRGLVTIWRVWLHLTDPFCITINVLLFQRIRIPAIWTECFKRNGLTFSAPESKRYCIFVSGCGGKAVRSWISRSVCSSWCKMCCTSSCGRGIVRKSNASVRNTTHKFWPLESRLEMTLIAPGSYFFVYNFIDQDENGRGFG